MNSPDHVPRRGEAAQPHPQPTLHGRELFSTMLHVALLARDSPLEAVARRRVLLFRDLHQEHRYRFFADLPFACDVDCTAVASRALVAAGDFDGDQPPERLRAFAFEILRSAAVRQIDSTLNETHGKSNGALHRLVFKVYWDDHVVDAPSLDRGLKNNPVVSVNALFPVMWAVRSGALSLAETVPLLEYSGRTVQRASATVHDIVRENLEFVLQHLSSGRWRDGCRYYPSPQVFLFFVSDLIREFPELPNHDALEAELSIALDDLDDGRQFDATSLEVACLALARAHLRRDFGPLLRTLAERQDGDGAWRDGSSLFTLGSGTGEFRSTVLTTTFALRALCGPLSRWTR